MTRVLVVSDSHGDNQILTDIVSAFKSEVDMMFHTGDSELEAGNSLIDDFVIVKGNMDFNNNLDITQSKNLNGVKIVETHGHLYSANFGLEKLIELGENNNANIVLYGHTHQLLAEMHESILFVNSGSISQPRGQFSGIGGTFAIIDITDKEYLVQYYDRQLNPVTDLVFRFKR